MTIQLNLEAEEAQYLSDILQMWIEGIEAEVKNLGESADDEVHWSRYGLRKQFKAAGVIKIRLDIERQTG